MAKLLRDGFLTRQQAELSAIETGTQQLIDGTLEVFGGAEDCYDLARSDAVPSSTAL
jgi:hypothetical protein